MARELRSHVVVPGAVGIYHCYRSVVRNGRLDGYDEFMRADVSHRRGWVEERLYHLARYMAVEVLDYELPASELHVVVCTRPDLTLAMDHHEVAARWLNLRADCVRFFSVPGPQARWDNGRDALLPRRSTLKATWPDNVREEPKRPAIPYEKIVEVAADMLRVTEYRARLSDVSWFMRLLCEPLARRANRETGSYGHFFEPRFKCKPIRNEAQLMNCPLYRQNALSVRTVSPLTATPEAPLTGYERVWKTLWNITANSAQLDPLPVDQSVDHAWLVPKFLWPQDYRQRASRTA